MSVFFRRRGEPPVPTIAVTITGAGDASYCYTTINGTKQYRAGTHEVHAGDTITFGVIGGGGFKDSGTVKIDGTVVLRVTDQTTQTYDWTVPNGISTVEIAMEYYPSKMYGIITVTTA